MKARLDSKTKILTAAVMLSSNMLFNFGYAENITIENVEDYEQITSSRIDASSDGNLNNNEINISDLNNTG